MACLFRLFDCNAHPNPNTQMRSQTPGLFSFPPTPPRGIPGDCSEGAHACPAPLRDRHYNARSPARRNAAHRAMANWGSDGVRLPPSPSATAHRIHRSHTLLHPVTAPPRPLGKSCQFPIEVGPRPSQPASATHRKCAERHTSTSSVLCRACRMPITVRLLDRESKLCLPATPRGRLAVGWRRVCAVPHGSHS